MFFNEFLRKPDVLAQDGVHKCLVLRLHIPFDLGEGNR